METYFICVYCGEENEIFIDMEAGEKQELTVPCLECSRPNLIFATYNHQHNEYDLEIIQEE